jgi:hypothetical protein
MNKHRDKRSASDSTGAAGTTEEEGFLSRWSRQKALSRDGIESIEPAPDPVESAPPTEPGEDASTAPDDTPPELPPLESLGEDSDYSAFLDAKVAPDLRRQALHKLFHSPKFNVRDGLDDYDLDFSNPEPLGDIVTAEMRHRIRVELERLAEREAESEPESDAPEEAPVSVARAGSADDPEPPIDPEPNDERTEPS